MRKLNPFDVTVDPSLPGQETADAVALAELDVVADTPLEVEAVELVDRLELIEDPGKVLERSEVVEADDEDDVDNEELEVMSFAPQMAELLTPEPSVDFR